MQYTDRYSELTLYANNINTVEGGFHPSWFKRRLSLGHADYAKKARSFSRIILTHFWVRC